MIFSETLEWYGSEAGLRAFRMQLASQVDASSRLKTAARHYWTQSTEAVAAMLRQLNPQLVQADALERSIFVLMLIGA
jgi:hypothetical protein